MQLSLTKQVFELPDSILQVVYDALRWDKYSEPQNKWDRLNSLYYIIDKHGNRVKFRCNVDQTWLFDNMHLMNLILKDRQRGMTTFIDLCFLDDCLFIDNIEAGIIAHKQDDAIKIFRRKIKYPYDHLPDWVKDKRPLVTKRNDELAFPNDSTIYVSTSMRSATVQRLHLSEFAKVCAKFPDKATEIISGSLEAIHPGEIVWIESTAEGSEGLFYEYCMDALKSQREGRTLTPLDFKIHFLGWTSDPDKRMEEEYPLTEANHKYFADLESKLKITLEDQQKYWYAAKKKIQRGEMFKENPATPEEAFEAAIEGAYYAEEMARVREEGRLCVVPFVEGLHVNTYWDLGYDDSTCIWFGQYVGREIHLIDYYENNHAGLLHYAKVIDGKAKEGGWVLDVHYGPHDVMRHELGTGKTLSEQAMNLIDPSDDKNYSFVFRQAPKINSQAEGIQAVRSILPICWFDKVKTTILFKVGKKEKIVGVPSLDGYRKEFDEKKETFTKTPLHNWASHGAKAFETLAMAHKQDGSFFGGLDLS